MAVSASFVGFVLVGQTSNKLKCLRNGPRPSQKIQLDWGTSGNGFPGRNSKMIGKLGFDVGYGFDDITGNGEPQGWEYTIIFGN